MTPSKTKKSVKKVATPQVVETVSTPVDPATVLTASELTQTPVVAPTEAVPIATAPVAPTPTSSPTTVVTEVSSAPVVPPPVQAVSQPVITYPTQEEEVVEPVAPVLADEKVVDPVTSPVSPDDAELAPAVEPAPTPHLTPLETTVSSESSESLQEKTPLSVPEVDLQAPLPADPEATTITDVVMVKAKREWRSGIIALIIFLALAAAVGYGYYRFTSTNKAVVSTATVVVSPTPTATTTSMVNESKPRLAVWNGSGVSGAAGKVAEQLTEAGYSVTEAKTAPSEQEGTTLFLADSVVEQKTTLLDVLKTAGVTIDAEKELSTTGDYEVRLVLGK